MCEEVFCQVTASMVMKLTPIEAMLLTRKKSGLRMQATFLSLFLFGLSCFSFFYVSIILSSVSYYLLLLHSCYHQKPHSPKRPRPRRLERRLMTKSTAKRRSSKRIKKNPMPSNGPMKIEPNIIRSMILKNSLMMTLLSCQPWEGKKRTHTMAMPRHKSCHLIRYGRNLPPISRSQIHPFGCLATPLFVPLSYHFVKEISRARAFFTENSQIVLC